MPTPRDRNGLQTSTFNYDTNGRISGVYIADARSRTVTFVTDVQGQVLTRVETDRNANQQDPSTRYWYFDGQRIGQATNNADVSTNYVGELLRRSATPNNAQGPFLGNQTAPTYGVDFDLAYQALTPGTVRSTNTAWTVRDGDTLQGMAAAVWGDASLWYLIAEANGLTSASILTAGQRLTVPARAGNVRNTTDTFRPYDPNEALGNLNPSQPQPPKKGGGCGVVGQIIMVAIAVAVTAVTAGAAAPYTSPIIAGIIGGAAGSVAAQSFGVATGMQDSIDWKAVGISAVSGGVNAGLSGSFTAAGVSQVAGDVVRGAAANAITQGVAVAAGLQDQFSWTNVATSAVISGFGRFGAGISDRFGGGYVGTVAGQTSSAIVGAGARSLLEGSSFGDNLIAALPDVIGATIGNAVGVRIKAGIQARQAQQQSARQADVDALLDDAQSAASSLGRGLNDIGSWNDGSDTLKTSILQREAYEPAWSRALRLDRAMNGPNATNDILFEGIAGRSYVYSIGAQGVRLRSDGSTADAGTSTRIRILADGPQGFDYRYEPATINGQQTIGYRFTRGDGWTMAFDGTVGSRYDLPGVGLTVSFEGPNEPAADRAIRVGGYGVNDSLFAMGKTLDTVRTDPGGAFGGLLSGLGYALDLRNSPAIARSLSHSGLETARDIGRAYEQGRLADHLSYGAGSLAPDLVIGAVTGGSSMVGRTGARMVAAEGAAFPEGLAFRIDLPKHLAGPDGFVKSGVLSGTHNQLNAIAALEARGAAYTLSPTGTRGISELRYNYTNTSGKQVLGSKTIYDPAVYGDNAMLDISQRAGQRAYEAYLMNPTQTRFDLNQGGVNVRAYINFDRTTGAPYVGNVHPIR